MGRKAKVSPKVKLKVVEDYLDGKNSVTKIASELGVNKSSIESWIRKYKTFGQNGLITSKTNVVYDSETKLKAITSYLEGTGSTYDICRKYSISSTSILHRWIKQYNNGHMIYKSQINKGDKFMTIGRKTTYKERVEIVSFCIANANEYNLTATKYGVSYQQVYTWVKKYNKNGYDALVDRRGKHKTFEELDETERIAAQLKLLEAENRRLKMENEFLKKLEEIERR